MMLAGLDAIGLTLKRRDAILAFQTARPRGSAVDLVDLDFNQGGSP